MSYRKLFCSVLVVLVMTGCATSKESLLPHDGNTMEDLWRESAGGSSGDSLTQQALYDRRAELRRPVAVAELSDRQTGFSHQSANEIYSQFARLPNPDLAMYVFPHLAGSEPVPVPGYSTLFPLYSKPQYAMPGETARPLAEPVGPAGGVR